MPNSEKGEDLMKTNEKSEMQISYSNKDFSVNERSQITNAFSKIVPVKETPYIRKVYGVLPEVIVFSLGFISGAVATGFFNALGSDLYRKAKEAVIKVIRGKRHPRLEFKMKYKGTEIQIETSTTDKVELNIIFDTINEPREVVIKTIDDKETPKMTYHIF